jgi:hypothetical protein
VKAFMLLYRGPATPPDASHAGWPEWFASAGERLIDIGSPMAGGFVVRADGSTRDETTPLNGFSIVAADDRDDALALIRSHPFLALGSEYAIEAFEVPRKATTKETT